ncbi:hypothetical protein J3R75_003180 [Oligosphaera ethanolica]|uniref:Uncharacterized protein n=1 Tax=Oligosphaera ethanolica TaxID=760260 RepID=A0AAE4AQG9_9BACT|nr:hypothetical protein [Oligosphaera ethanolica]
MDWTVGTNWTVGIDSRRIGLIGDRLDSWECGRPGGNRPRSDGPNRLIGQVRPGGPYHA